MALALAVAIVLGVLLVAVANLNGWLDTNRERLAALASEAAGRPIRFERAEVAFSSGLAVRLVGLRIAEDPRFGDQDFLSLEDAYVGVRILPALQRRIEVRGVRLVAPTIRVIQTEAGFNFSSLLPSGEDAPPASGEPEREAASFAIAIAALEIADGTVHYADRREADGLLLVIGSLESSGTDLTLDGPVDLAFSGTVRSEKAADAGLESRFEGRVALQALSPLKGEVALAIPRLHPAILGLRLSREGAVERLDALSIDVSLPIDPAETGYGVAVRSEGGHLANFDFEDLAIDLRYRPTAQGGAAALERFGFAIAGGRVGLMGDVLLAGPEQSPFKLQMELRSLEAGRLAEGLLGTPRDALSGVVEGDVSLSGRSLEWVSLKRSLAGALRLEVGQGALEQVNVLNAFVSRLTTDPGLGRLAAQAIREVMPEALEGDRTPFQSMDLALEIADGAVLARNLSVDARDFSLAANGRVGLDGAIAAAGSIRFPERISKRMLDRADPLAPLLAEDETVTLPLKIGGTVSAPRLAPDAAALANRAQKAFNVRLSRSIVDSLFGTPRAEGESDQAADPSAETDRESAEALIQKGLGRLLGR
jgi:uncharacterized protein involved in outer membrane biogenesis